MQLQPISRIALFVADAACADFALLPGLLIRRLEADDRAVLAAHLIALPHEDRRTRFGGNVSDAAIRRHCDHLNLQETICFGAVDAIGDVVGAALGFTYGAADGRRPVAEIAVSVVPAYRRRGLGSDLVARVFDAVAANGADAAVFEFDPSNGAIKALVRHLGGMIAPLAHSCVIPLPPPDRGDEPRGRTTDRAANFAVA